MDAVSNCAESTTKLPQLSALAPPQPQYRCPGEPHSISRSVHLARLAAFYPKCRQCQHRHDTGELAPATVERIQSVEQQRAASRSLLQVNGFRGVFLNELTPATAGRIAGALARRLWDETPLIAQAPLSPRTASKRSGPSVVAGYDERPSSPAILAAVCDSLRLMGCQVIDVGSVSTACFSFAVHHLQAAGGVYVTGSGCDAAWTGLDVLVSGALPLSVGAGLDDIQQLATEGYSRAVRRAGFQRAFQAVVPYEAGLWKHFHALRPLKVVCATRMRSTRETLNRIFAKLPCKLIEVEPTAPDRAPLRREVLLETVSRRVPRVSAHLGLVIDDDGCRCQFTDERGRLVDSDRIGVLLANHLLSEHPHSTICVDGSRLPNWSTQLPSARMHECATTAASLSAAMRSTNAVLGCNSPHCFWHREAFPTPDAILTLARVLQALSRSDAAFSAVLPKNFVPVSLEADALLAPST